VQEISSNKFIPPHTLNSAVLFLVFNRPDTTAQVFEAIRKAKPPRLYVAADGPRADKPGEHEKCEQVRLIASQVDWPCELKTLFRHRNLGCKNAVSSAITWFFEQEEQGILLEDDCLPHPDFFTFCETLLKRYRDDERIFVITGDNFQASQLRGKASYYFSKYNHCWGWATWRRAWRHYQGDLRFWPEWRKSAMWKRQTPDKVERRYWERIFARVRAGQIDTWDYPWTGSVWYHGGLTATPNVNLVSNIGFGPDSTHTASADSLLAEIATAALGEIIHPEKVVQDRAADRYAFDHVFGGKNQRFPRALLCLPLRVAGFLYRRLKQGIA